VGNGDDQLSSSSWSLENRFSYLGNMPLKHLEQRTQNGGKKWNFTWESFPPSSLNYFKWAGVIAADMNLVIEWAGFPFWALGLIDGWKPFLFYLLITADHWA
jgi:hypothetical protein